MCSDYSPHPGPIEPPTGSGIDRNWLLVPSPLLGPASWKPVGAVLSGHGQPTFVPATAMTTTVEIDHVTPWIEQIRHQYRRHRQARRQSDSTSGADAPTVVVSHSAACPRTPLLVDRLLADGWDIEAMVLVDGRYPDGKSFSMCEPHFSDLLDGLLRPDDYLPPWPRWWGSLVSGFVVDPAARDVVFSEAPPVPRTWFDQGCSVPDLPEDLRRGYLAFGPLYQQQLERARAEGWFTLTLTGDHLHQVVQPEPVAATLMAMVTCMADNPGATGPGALTTPSRDE
jgi:hypothetical protein